MGYLRGLSWFVRLQMWSCIIALRGGRCLFSAHILIDYVCIAEALLRLFAVGIFRAMWAQLTANTLN